VLCVARDRTAGDGARRGQHAVALARAVAQAPRAHAGAQELQRPGVAERLEPFERAQPPDDRISECGHAAAPPRRQSTALWPPKPNESLSATGALPFTSSARAVFGT